jgi:serine/threonine protein kinase
MKTFPVWKDAESFKYHLEEKEGKPIKLGDGSFGVVVRVRMLSNVAGALKLFYANDRPSMKARRRFEIKLGEMVVEKEKEIEGVVDKSNLILPEAICKDFTKSEAYEAHAGYFREAGIHLSGEGVVMPCFDCTLKDLLERGAPPGRLCDGVEVKVASAPGYSILAKLDSATREASILPLLRQIAMALQSLHAYGLHHHDLKPANVLVKSEAGNLRVALGDFGFADPNLTQSTLVDLNDEAMALGTRHYRSVEQKDYLDVCEADVTVKAGTGKTVDVTLETRDAKFYDSIIEKGDLCIFRKDSERTGWPIEAIRRKEGDPTFSTTIILKTLNDVAGIASDSRTQVAFLKRQTHRTDLFGFGALAFDMLTAGKSPERFYDLLRPLDKVRDDVQEGQITSLVNAYRQFVRAPSAEPRHRALFNELRTGATFASPKFVGMLLRCMLSKPRDSFYSAYPDVAECFRAVVTAVEELINHHNALIYLPDKTNPLWNGGREAPTPPAVEVGFEETLQAHRTTFHQAPGTLSLSKGYRLLRAVEQTLRDRINKHRLGTSYFTPCDPSHLNADGSFDENSVAYATESAFLEALQSGEAVHFRDEIEGNNFLPPSMRYRSRVALFNQIERDSKDASLSSGFSISYSESVPAWPGISTGDVVRIAIESEPIQLFRIANRADGALDLSPIAIKGNKRAESGVETPKGEFKGEIVKQIDAVDYYLGLLGIYIHQIFFISQVKTFESIPGKIWWLEQAAYLRMLDWEALAQRCQPDKPNAKEPIASVQREAAKLYIWLLMGLYKHSSTNERTTLSASDLLATVTARLRKLEEGVAAVLGKSRDWLVEATSDEVDVIASAIDKQADGKPKELEAFDQLLATIVTRDCLQEAAERKNHGFGFWQ